MKNSENSISTCSSIWDLHIHSCQSPKSSGEFQSLNVNDYINLLDSVFSGYEDLKMISFTDHNFISKEVYKAAYDKKWNISIIIGIEVDTFLDQEGKDNNDIKHVIYYFDPNKFDLDVHPELINKQMQKGAVILSDFLNFLVTEIKVPFLISPHFMKQGKRGIDYKWLDVDDIKKNIDKYIDQMFCFWETSSSITIHRATQYLKDFDRENKVSIISFSDSNDRKKLENYLKNPCQYFNALPTFDGIRMVGSDVRRIVTVKEEIELKDRPSFIGKVIQGPENEIFFSNKLNTIIGGRGTGKSLLIDGIAYQLNYTLITNDEQLKDRVNYLNALNFQAYDLNGNLLTGHDFRFEYFNQGYVLNLFKNNEYDKLSNLYFRDEFSRLKEFDVNSIREKIKEDIKYKKITDESIDENLVSLCEKIVYLDDKDYKNVFKNQKDKKCLDYLDFNSLLGALSKPAIVPAEIKDNKEFLIKRLELVETIYKEIYKYNIEIIKGNFYSNFYNKYAEKLSELSETKKTKIATIKLLRNKVLSKFNPILNRIARINAIIKNNEDYSDTDENIADGFNGNRFVFARELKVQKLLVYLHEVFRSYFDKTKIQSAFKVDRDNIKCLKTLIDIYCFYPKEYLLQSKTLSELENELDNISNLRIEVSNEVYYEKNGELIIKLRDVSPGTKANILMEYIVFKDASTPLLIDQPEDNIDNKTIFNDLTNWFNSLKSKRQVIVATHDPNIVVNADAENVIVCEQTNKDKFNYKNGALEYSDIINDVSNILDGGKEALERRLTKYGKTN